MKKKLLTVSLIALLCACGGTNNPSSNNSISSSSNSSNSSEVVKEEVETNVEDFTFATTSLGLLAVNEDGGITITKYTCKKGSTKNVVIPEEYTRSGSSKTYRITRVDNKAFYFAGGITTLTLSKEIKVFPSNAVEGCSTLKGIYVDEANPYYSSRNDLLYSKDGKRLICGPNGKEEVLIDKDTEIISESAFSNNRTSKFIIEEGVTTIETRAFERCKKAASLTIPNSVTTIGEYCFANSDFSELYLGSGITTIPSYAIYQCPSLKRISIPGNVKNIQYSAIGDNQHLSSITFEEGVETLESYSISFNSSLTRITFPSSLRTIDDYAFISSPALKSVVVSEGVEKIGTGAFSHSTLLETISLPSTVKEIGQSINQYCTNFKNYILPNGNDNFVLHDSALYSSDMKRLLSVPQGYGEPGYHTFEVASTVEVIDNFAFNYSIRISKVVLPSSLVSIGAGLFVNSAVNEIEFLGTLSDWENVSKGGIVEGAETTWNYLCNVREVKCSDANYEIPQEPVVEEEVE